MECLARWKAESGPVGVRGDEALKAIVVEPCRPIPLEWQPDEQDRGRDIRTGTHPLTRRQLGLPYQGEHLFQQTPFGTV
jgi:hypothetical protein